MLVVAAKPQRLRISQPHAYCLCADFLFLSPNGNGVDDCTDSRLTSHFVMFVFYGSTVHIKCPL